MEKRVQTILDGAIVLSLAAIVATLVLWWLFFRLGDGAATGVSGGGAFVFLFVLVIALGCRPLSERGAPEA